MVNSGNSHDNSTDHEDLSEGETKGRGSKFNLIAQYIKDLSFESPKSPESLKGPGENPNIQIGIHVNGKKIQDNVYEVCLEFSADAKNDEGFIYKLELNYAGLFRLENIPEDIMQPVLLVDCPALLYPFVRFLVIQLTREGGFPPLQLDPIDFARLYRSNMEREEKARQMAN